MQITTEQLFDHARTHNAWLDRPVPEDTLRQLYDMMKFGPTSANCSPLRIQFVISPQAKARLVPLMDAGNQAKTAQAPVTAILGMDLAFYEHLGELFPHNPGARSWFEGQPAKIEATAFRNSSLQGGYFILAARALGLDCGPMSGFDAAKVDAEFWAGTQVKTNFICNLGYGDARQLFPRSPRLSFEQACRIV
ncbi:MULTISPECIES: malonic semialdehyde reductase [Caldimonas]|uniref:malonic semialdehyde reductase n=1 Tax=Caldimonas TaxID=196013 RepID=UPI00036188EA|nr:MULTISPECIES: malonic semialdehyde reductase [Caldimonas]MCX7660019.1 malonic semialdehyde reductase [Caldimonas manganoxidans]GIX23187.1 MAG: putative NADH dehydrogenase/NAD(P)H nitroreductase [Caldimonas sp.]